MGAFEQLFGPGRGEFEQKIFQKFKCPGGCPGGCWSFDLTGKANEDKLLRTHCCRHKCFPVCSRAQHLLRTQILCLGGKNVSDFVQKHFVFGTNVSQYAQPKKYHGQQCVLNNASSFTRACTSHACDGSIIISARCVPVDRNAVLTRPFFHFPRGLSQ